MTLQIGYVNQYSLQECDLVSQGKKNKKKKKKIDMFEMTRVEKL